MGLSISSRFAPPAMAMTLSLSLTATMPSVALRRLSHICAAKSDNSPIGEYFLNISSPSLSVKISNGSPSRIRMVRRISLGMTTRPRSSIRRTIPVAFMLYLPFLCVFVMLADSTSLCLLWKNMRARVLIISIPQERSCGISSCRMSENIDIQTGIW